MTPWLLLLACRPEPGTTPTLAVEETGDATHSVPSADTAPSRPTASSTDTATPTDDGGIHWVHPPAPVPVGGLSQDHATVALHPSGTALVVYGVDATLRAVTVDPAGQVSPTPLDGPSNHGQVVATPQGFLTVATLNDSDILLGGAFTTAGLPDGALVPLSETHPFLPDVSVHVDDDGVLHGVVASTDTIDLACLQFDGGVDAATPAPCPVPADPERATGSVSVASTPAGPRYAWTELTTDGSTAVLLADGVGPTVLVADIPYGAGMAGRPMLSVDGDREMVVYRGAESPDDVVGSWLWHRGPDGEHTWRIGRSPATEDVERVTISGAAQGQVVVAWEEASAMWIQRRSALDVSALGVVVSVATEPDREPRRPSVDLVLGDDGVLQGVISWESAVAGSAVEDDGRRVRIRRFELD